MNQMSPAYDSKSNGFIERASQALERQIKTMKLAPEKNIGQKLMSDASIIHWLMEYASVILKMFEVGSDGKVPYQRLCGRNVKHKLSWVLAALLHPLDLDFHPGRRMGTAGIRIRIRIPVY